MPIFAALKISLNLNQKENSMNTEVITSKLNWRYLLGVAATMAIVLIMYNAFVSEYMTNDGEIKRKFKLPKISE